MPFDYSKGFRMSFREFCQTTDLAGFTYLHQNNGTMHKVLWGCVHVILSVSTITIIVFLWKNFMLNPTVTTLASSNYPVTTLPFPGIAICNVNKISKRRAEALAKTIATAAREDEKDVVAKMKLLGGLYDYESPDPGNLVEFQRILDRLPREISDIRNLLLTLTTPCHELLRTCMWKGSLVNCSEIFTMRLTFEGFCCSFNYNKITAEMLVCYVVTGRFNTTSFRMGAKPAEMFYGEAGLERGLIVVINNDVKDYFHTTIASNGVKVHVFVPSDYPDKVSGSLNENLIGISSEAFLEIIPTTVNTISDVMSYPLSQRKCTFETEVVTAFGVYSQSDCMVDCRIKSMEALCGCVPFSMPTQSKDIVCNLPDVSCMENFKNKWNAMVPLEEDLDNGDFELEKQNALRCDNPCYPSCTGTSYAVATETVPFLSKYGEEIASSDDSVVNIFYRRRYSDFYVQDVVYYWFEILSNFGGIFGLLMGFSLIVVTEIIVSFTYKLFLHSWQK